MIVKKRCIPLNILILEALLRRLPKNHAKRHSIMEELSRRKAGFIGEKSIDFHLKSLEEKKYMIFYDLNLPNGQYNCQIDTLLITSEFASIIEVKNMAGKLIFDTDNEQLIQVNEGIEKGYPYPISQAERHQSFLKNILPPFPIDYLIVSAHRHSILSFAGSNSNQVRQKVCKADRLLHKIASIEKTHSKKVLSQKELRKIRKTLIKMNTPPTSYLLQNYEIKKTEILTGLYCPKCFYLPLIRKKRKWFCPSCHTFPIDALLYSLQDYFLLFDEKISSEEFRIFAHLDSQDAAKRQLLSANLSISGSNKDRIYFPDKLPLENLNNQ